MLSAIPVVTAITQSPLIVVNGQEATLSFSVTNDIPAVTAEDIVWRFTDQDQNVHILDEEDDRHTFSEDKRTLTIPEVHELDEGLYTLEATNAAGMDYASIFVDVQCT